jgi:hypothetical protein
MKFNKPINRETEINDETFVVTMDEGGVSFRVKGKRKSVRAEWPAILFIARGESEDTGRDESGHSPRPDEEAAPDIISRGASAGDGTPES